MHNPSPGKTTLTLPLTLWQWNTHMAAHTEETTLGQRNAQLRRQKGLTQTELAARLQVSQPVVSDYENDVIRLPADVVIQIASILDTSTDELLGMKRPATNASPIKNRRLYRRMQEIERLPRRDQDALLRTIEAFISKTA